MENKIDRIIAHVLSGNASSEDILVLSDWLNADEGNKRQFRLLKSYWDAEVSFNHSILPSLSAEHLQQKIARRERKGFSRRFWFMVVPVAASVAMLLMASYLLFLRSPETENREYFTYLAGKDQSSLVLADGTKVILNEGSSLRYSDAYGSENRSVQLEGEAYFDVRKMPLSPFRVELGETSIHVLGTIFTVKARANSSDIVVTLLEGAVRLESSEQQVLFAPNQQLIFNRNTRQVAINEVNAYDEIAWKDGLRRYSAIAFSRLIGELETAYNVRIVVHNKKLKDPAVTVSGTFDRDQSLEQVFTVISRSLPIRWSKKGEIYYIE